MTTDRTELPTYPPVVSYDLILDPVYREMQHRPAFKAQMPKGEPIWIATRYEDCKVVYGDRRMGKAVGHGRDTPRTSGESQMHDTTRLDNMDPPDHTRVRRLASTAFSPQQIRSMTGWIEQMTSDLLDDIVAAGPGADFMELFAWKLPLNVIGGILGAPLESVPVLKGWVDTLTSEHLEFEKRYEAYMNIQGFVRDLIASKRDSGGDTNDLLQLLVQARDDDDRLSEDELVSLCTTLFLGGFETTAAQLGSTVWTLMTYRPLWQELVDDPDLIPNGLEELWRWIPSFRHGRPMIRWAAEDVELSDGVVIPAGDPALAEHQIANRDETVFDHGWDLDFHRMDPAPHLSLSWGPHRCMGARLAHLEVEATLRALLTRFPNLELTIPSADVEWSPDTFLRSAQALPIAW